MTPFFHFATRVGLHPPQLLVTMLNLTPVLLVGRWLRTRRTCPYINGSWAMLRSSAAALNILRLTLPRCTTTLLHRVNGVFFPHDGSGNIVIGFTWGFHRLMQPSLNRANRPDRTHRLQSKTKQRDAHLKPRPHCKVPNTVMKHNGITPPIRVLRNRDTGHNIRFRSP